MAFLTRPPPRAMAPAPAAAGRRPAPRAAAARPRMGRARAPCPPAAAAPAAAGAVTAQEVEGVQRWGRGHRAKGWHDAGTPTARSTPTPLLSPAAAVAVVRAAARRAWRVRPADTLAAILTLERAKLDPAPLLDAVAGGPDGRRWRLMFTSGTDAVRKAVAGDAAAGGVYVPITAVQGWRALDSRIENGIFLGWLGAFCFRGDFTVAGRKFAFDFDTVRLRLGPKWFEFPLTKKEGGSKPASAGPFFLVAYADDEVCVARGRSGGVALWARATADWQAKAGVDA